MDGQRDPRDEAGEDALGGLREPHAQETAPDREADPLNQRLLRQSAPGCAHRHLNSRLTLVGDRSRQQQARHIGARGEEHDGCDGDHRQAQGAHQGPELRVTEPTHPGARQWRLGVGAAHAERGGEHVSTRRFQRHAVTQPGDRLHSTRQTIVAPVGPRHQRALLPQRDPRVEREAHDDAVKPGRGDPDDGQRSPVDKQRPAQEAGVAAKVSLPRRVADNDDGCGVASVLRAKRPTRGHGHAQHVEELRIDELHPEGYPHGVRRPPQMHPGLRVSGHAGERRRALQPLVKNRQRDGGHPIEPPLVVRHIEGHERPAIGNRGKRMPDDVVDPGEHGSVRADPQPDGEDRTGSKPWAVPQPAECKAEVTEDAVHAPTDGAPRRGFPWHA
jgi:hypothetical protein